MKPGRKLLGLLAALLVSPLFSAVPTAACCKLLVRSNRWRWTSGLAGK